MVYKLSLETSVMSTLSRNVRMQSTSQVTQEKYTSCKCSRGDKLHAMERVRSTGVHVYGLIVADDDISSGIQVPNIDSKASSWKHSRLLLPLIKY